MANPLHEIEPSALKNLIDNDQVIIIDVREQAEYDEGHIPDAKLFPTSKFDPSALPKNSDKKLVFYCRSGMRSAKAAVVWREYLAVADAYSLKGGIIAWMNAGFPTIV